jgi:hypothetical protein
MCLYKTTAILRARREETAKSIVRLRITKLEDELIRKGGGNIIVLGVFGYSHVFTCTSIRWQRQ